MKKNINTFYKSKGHEKLTMLTAYDYSVAKIIDKSGIDAILVGDSLGMVCLGYKDTLSVTIDDMIHHGKAVVKGTENSMVVIDMPFMSYEISVEKALENASRIIKETGAQALKLEGGFDILPQIKAIVKAKIPVMGHLGLTPQSINVFGGFKVQGKNEDTANCILKEAIELEKAGVFAIVLECIPAKLAKLITEKINIPTIGIGAGNDCDGQILVWQDVVSIFNDFVPKFVKSYANVGNIMTTAFKEYIKEVKSKSFPEEKHTFLIKEEIIEKLY